MKSSLGISKIILFLLAFTFVVKSAELRQVEIKPLNRATFYLTNITQFTSSLSPDKQRVVLNISDCSVSQTAKQSSSSGVIKDVLVSQQDQDIEISISLKGQRGYWAVSLPYSNSIIVEIFSWDNLSKGEELFFQSLLGWEDNTLLEEDLIKTASENITGANAMLGIYYMKAGHPTKATSYLLKAEENKTNIADVYAALSQIYSLKNKSVGAQGYAQKFREMTNLSGFPELPSLDKSEDIILPQQVFTQVQDSLQKDKAKDSIVIKDSRATDSKLTFLEEYSEMIFYSLLIILLLFTTLFITFKSLKKSQSKDPSKMIDSRFAEEVRQAKKASDEKITKLQNLRSEDDDLEDEAEAEKKNILLKKYQKDNQEKVAKKKKETSNKKKEISKQSGKVPPIKKVRIKKQENVKEKNSSKDIENFLENYIPIKRDQDKEELEKAKDELLLDSDVYQERKTNSPDVNLALHLAGEKQKMKQKHISELSDDESTDKKDLEKKAKESGLETGSVQTKSLINKLEKDKSKLSKLSSKFSPSPDDDDNKQ